MGTWVPLVEYSVRKSISLSTLRRYIKTNRIEFKKEKGRYLIFDDQPPPSASASASVGTQKQFTALKSNLLKANEEIAELKTLIALYEENSRPKGIEK